MNDSVSFSILLKILDSSISFCLERYKEVSSDSALNSFGFLRASVVLNQIKTEIMKEVFEKNEKLS